MIDDVSDKLPPNLEMIRGGRTVLCPNLPESGVYVISLCTHLPFLELIFFLVSGLCFNDTCIIAVLFVKLCIACAWIQ